MPATVVQKASRTYETPEPSQTSSGSQIAAGGGFLTGTRTQPRSRTVAGQFLNSIPGARLKMLLVVGAVRLNPFVQPVQYVVIPEDAVGRLEHPVVFLLENQQF